MGDLIKFFFLLHCVHKILLKANVWISLLTEAYGFDMQEDTGHGLIVWSVWLIIGTVTWGLRNITYFLYGIAKAVIVERCDTCWFSCDHSSPLVIQTVWTVSGLTIARYFPFKLLLDYSFLIIIITINNTIYCRYSI